MQLAGQKADRRLAPHSCADEPTIGGHRRDRDTPRNDRTIATTASIYLIETVRAGFFQFLLELLGVFLRDAFLDLARDAFDQVLGFLQAQAGRAADDLDHADLLVAEAFQDDVELGLLFGRGSRSAAAAAGRPSSRAPPAAGLMPWTLRGSRSVPWPA